MPADPKRVESVFNRALELAPADRAALLAAECGADAELRDRVDRLLAAHEELGEAGTAAIPGDPATASFADSPATESHTPRSDAGSVLAGKYKLIEEIGEGGMGSVWMAQQTEPVKRFVAVKLIKAGMDSRAVLARFEAERQALALMDHPNIAKVLDAGATPDGRPFFVMELVKGVPISRFCDEKRLTPRERLELFVPVCQAIQHAHQKGIIHRDIKPSNVLVALYDDRPVPKVIDFGVAKAAGQQLTEKTLATGFGAVVGTPEYMSPEQASFNNMDIDTRSDVYALGVLLYELLAGSPPFSRKELEKAGLLEIFRVIREQEPPRPSTKLSTADALPTLSANRGTEPRRLAALLRGELDWIVMKALEKDRNRRYETANGFAADVQRYLAGEPVQAVPPSTAYRLKKFLRRNKGQVVAAALVLGALLAGVIGTSVGMVRAENRRVEAEQARAAEAERAEGERKAREEVERQRNKIAAEGARAERALKRAEAVTTFLTTRLLGQANPSENPVGDKLTVRQLLDRAAEEIERGSLPADVEGPIRAVLGKTYAGLSLDHLAEPHLRRALALTRETDGPDADTTIDVTNDLAFVLRALDQMAEAERLTLDLIARLKATRGGTDPKTLDTQNTLAVLYKDGGRLEESERMFRELLPATEVAHGRDAEETLVAVLNLVTVLRDSGSADKRAEAEKLLRRYLPVMKDRWGNQKPGIFVAYNELSLLLCERGNYQEAEEYSRTIIADGPRVFGPKSDVVLNAKHNLGNTYLEIGRNSDAEKQFREVVATEAELVVSDRSRMMTLFNLGLAIYRQDRVGESLTHFRTVHKTLLELLPPSHPDVLQASGQLVEALIAAGDPAEAESLSRKNLQLALGSRERRVRRMAPTLQTDLGKALLEQGRAAEAERVFREAVAGFRRDDPADAYLPDAESLLGAALLAQGKYTEAEPLLTAGYRGLERLLTTIPPRARFAVIEALNRLVVLYRRWDRPEQAAQLASERARLLPNVGPLPSRSLEEYGKALFDSRAYAEAEPPLRESLTIREKVQPDAWNTFNTQSMLGGAILGQKKYAEAEPLLLKGYQGMKQREKTIPPAGRDRLPEAVDRLVELYEATNRPTEAKKWRAERAKYPTVAPMPREVRR